MKITLFKALEICKKEFSKDPSTCFHAIYKSDSYMKSYLDERKRNPQIHQAEFKRYDSHWELQFNQKETLEEHPEHGLLHIYSLEESDHLYVFDDGDVTTFKDIKVKS